MNDINYDALARSFANSGGTSRRHTAERIERIMLGLAAYGYEPTVEQVAQWIGIQPDAARRHIINLDQRLSHTWKRVSLYGYEVEVSGSGAVRMVGDSEPQRQIIDRYGYMQVRLGGRKVPVAKLVLLAHLGPQPSPIHQVCHSDGHKVRNLLRNLRWGTPADQARDRARHGTVLRGVQVRGAVLDDEKVHEIDRLVGAGLNYAELAGRYGCSPSTIANARRRKTWRHVERAVDRVHQGDTADSDSAPVAISLPHNGQGDERRAGSWSVVIAFPAA